MPDSSAFTCPRNYLHPFFLPDTPRPDTDPSLLAPGQQYVSLQDELWGESGRALTYPVLRFLRLPVPIASCPADYATPVESSLVYSPALVSGHHQARRAM